MLHRAEADQGAVTERLAAIMTQAAPDAASTLRDVAAAHSYQRPKSMTRHGRPRVRPGGVPAIPRRLHGNRPHAAKPPPRKTKSRAFSASS
jgi:hypothetical protein